MNRFLKISFLILASGLLLFILILSVYINVPYPVKNDKLITIKQGLSISEIGEVLYKNGIILDKNLFVTYSVLKGDPLKAGIYKFNGIYSLKEIHTILSEGKEQLFPFTIYPGDDIYDIADRLEKEGFLDREVFLSYVLDKENVNSYGLVGNSFEGYFPPETYYLSKNSDVDYIVGAFIRYFKDRYMPYKEKFQKKGMDFYEGMIIASMVEKESPLLEERPIIAGIIIKRLKKNMYLQIDPTVIYSLKIEGRWDGKLGGDVMKFKSPYNTYVNLGLPPTPISSFSIESLEAVLNYKETDYLYFFSPDGKKHIFSKNYSEHLKKLRKYK
ncbi:endolytic transglycosylase MltG [Persephonella sp.]